MPPIAASRAKRASSPLGAPLKFAASSPFCAIAGPLNVINNAVPARSMPLLNVSLIKRYRILSVGFSARKILLFGSIRRELRGAGVGFEDPGRPVGVISAKNVILVGAEIDGPNHSRMVDIRTVLNPLTGRALRIVA